MLFRTISTIFMMFAGLAVAGGGRPSENPGDGGDAGDTITVEGTVNSISPRDSMIIIESQQGMDTVYYDQNTKFTMGNERVIKPNSQIKIKYVKEGERKIATIVQPAATNGNGSDRNDTGDGSRKPDTTGRDYPDTTDGSKSQDTGNGGWQDTGSGGTGQDTTGEMGR